MKRRRPDLIVVADGAESEKARHFRRKLTFGLRNASKTSRRADIDDENDSKFAFFSEFFHVSGAEPRGHVPINGTDFIARLIFADVLEIHAAPFKDAVIIPSERCLDQTFGLDFERADLLQNLGGSLLCFTH